MLDCGEITIILRFKSDFVKLEAFRRDHHLTISPIMKGGAGAKSDLGILEPERNKI